MPTDNILAVRILPDRELAPNQFGVQVRTGLEAVLAVRTILAKVQTTVFSGESLHMIWHDVGQLSTTQMFAFFMNEYINKPMTWSQLSEMPPPMDNFRTYLQAQPPAAPPTAEGTMTLLTCGYDPLRGYWAEFAGNYFLTTPIFKNWASLVVRDGPDFKGFQGKLDCPWHNKK